MNKILHQSIPASPIKSLGRVPGLANAWPLGSTKFVNAPPLGLTMRANANGVGGGGTWVQLELTDALVYNIKGKCNYSFGGLEPALHFA